MSAIDKLRKHFFTGGSPPTTDEVLRDAVLELAGRLDEMVAIRDGFGTADSEGEAKPVAPLEELMERVAALEEWSHKPVLIHDGFLKKPRKKYKRRKNKNPRGGKGTDHTDAQARVETSGSPPPDGSPAPSSRYGMEQVTPRFDPVARTGVGTKALGAAHGASLQTRPEND